MSKETRTRGVLNRTKKKYKQHPTPGREQAIKNYEKYLKRQAWYKLIGSLAPCPCCGNIQLYVGTLSSDSMGVHCRSGEDVVDRILISRGEISPDDIVLQGCGLQLAVPVPDEYPRKFPKDLVGMEAVEHLRFLTLVEAVRRWNKRI